MNAASRSGPVPFHTLLLGALPLLVLTACGTTTQAPDGRPAPPEAETVDIGYGEIDRKDLIGSVSSVPDEDLNSVGYTSIADMLSRVPGVRVVQRPGGAMSVRIRGASSVLGGEEPLWVIDGMAMTSGGAVNSLNPNAIASITVLKDAGSTAVYGSRGANGVILIRTKRGAN